MATELLPFPKFHEYVEAAMLEFVKVVVTEPQPVGVPTVKIEVGAI